ncbi:DUF3556 domain-containing protein [[Mycobacterium] crassicus]|uniref:DUF3556 domain-containing protein n=1 Tax=[Mycobacterium] crassicus TaxID=2872309 RepID=A0ABU5XBG8_9MYCO|nr:DUF3556 domain-containing protein [Mycolicibacter sp. MYC098]MEB3019609.1 DUF3556 domain-containing protein [Mycolicibacter sp. MYC098]
MGFTQPYLPDIDPEELLRRPLRDRLQFTAIDWVENGFGAPKMVHCIYLVKLFVFFTLGGAIIATATSPGVAPFWRIAEWWNQPIVYQKVILWIVLCEILGIAGAWGPLMGRVKPMTGGYRFWLKPDTIRQPPWPWLSGTGGDRRTWGDVGLYVAVLISLVVPLVLPGVPSASLTQRLPGDTSGLVDPMLLGVAVGLLLLLGLRDKTAFLSARSDQYLWALIFFMVLPFTDMIIALKLLIVASWTGAAFSKLGKHFSHVVSPMVSNAPWTPKWFRRAVYRDPPRDLRPSPTAHLMAHGLGTILEFGAPLILLFSTNKTLTVVAIVLVWSMHAFIISTFPLAVPLEWNVVFIYAAAFLFLGFPAWEGYAVTDMSPPWLVLVVAPIVLFLPVLGNIRPDKVSFLWSYRQYAGNWACSLWAFAPGAEEKLNRVTRPCGNLVDQFVQGGYEPAWAEATMQRFIGFRSLNPQGRGEFSVLLSRVSDIETRTVREGEFQCGSMIGFSFGEGHLHNEQLVSAIQSRVGYAPGELVVVMVESEVFGSGVQRYRLVDAALGEIERGTWRVADAADAQPWLPEGPIPLTVTRRADRLPEWFRDQRAGDHEAMA